MLLRHLLCIRTFCGPRRRFPCHPVYNRRLPRTRAFWWRTCWGSADLPPSCTGASRLQAHLLRPREPQLWITLLGSTSPGLRLCQKAQARHKHHLPITTQITWNLEWMQSSRQQHETVSFSYFSSYINPRACPKHFLTYYCCFVLWIRDCIHFLMCHNEEPLISMHFIWLICVILCRSFTATINTEFDGQNISVSLLWRLIPPIHQNIIFPRWVIYSSYMAINKNRHVIS